MRGSTATCTREGRQRLTGPRRSRGTRGGAGAAASRPFVVDQAEFSSGSDNGAFHRRRSPIDDCRAVLDEICDLDLDVLDVRLPNRQIGKSTDHDGSPDYMNPAEFARAPLPWLGPVDLFVIAQ